ncbi:MAG: hypothetical protein V1781_07490 [Bacteroidota bacterium]
MGNTKLLALCQRPGWQKLTTIQNVKKENEELKKKSEYFYNRFKKVSEKNQQMEERLNELRKIAALLREDNANTKEDISILRKENASLHEQVRFLKMQLSMALRTSALEKMN